MSNFQRKYTDEQRDAVAMAYEDRRVRPAKRVVELAAAGELVHEGQPLSPFTIGVDTVRDMARTLRRRRLGEKNSQLSKLPPRDAVEVMRQRLVNLCDGMLSEQERKQPKDRDPARAREIANALKATQAIPGKDEPRKPAPGQRTNGKQTEGAVRSGMAGDLLKAHRQQGRQAMTAQGAKTHSNGHTENTENDAAQHSDEAQEQEEGQQDNAPGSLARSAVTGQLVA